MRWLGGDRIINKSRVSSILPLSDAGDHQYLGARLVSERRPKNDEKQQLERQMFQSTNPPPPSS